MRIEPFSFKNGHNLKIVGEVWHPEKSKGLAFVQHGLSSNRKRPHVQLLAKLLHQTDYTTVIFDSTHTWGESGGKLSGITLTSHWQDLEDVIGWAKMQSFYAEPYVLGGHSMGGFSVLHLAQKYADKTKAVIAVSPVISGKLRIEAYNKYNPQELADWKQNGYMIKVSRDDPNLSERIPYGLMEDYMRYDILKDAEKITCPTLIVIGEKDDTTPPEHQALLRDQLAGPTDLVVLADCPHSFREPAELQALENSLSGWIERL